MRKPGAQTGQARAQGHTARQHAQGLEPGLSLLGPGKPREEGGLEGMFAIFLLKPQRPPGTRKERGGAGLTGKGR